MTYQKPLVTIELDEYQGMKKYIQSMEDSMKSPINEKCKNVLEDYLSSIPFSAIPYDLISAIKKNALVITNNGGIFKVHEN